MSKQTYLNEEHIIAYLDGELQLDAADVRKALQSDPALARIVTEHYALSRTFARSSIESRFQLPSSLDARTSAFLTSALAASTQKVQRSVSVVDTLADSASRIVLPLYKRLWFRRTSYGFAAAAVIAILWLSYSPREIVVEPTAAPAVTQTAMNTQQPESISSLSQTELTETISTKPVNMPVKQTGVRAASHEVSAPSVPSTQSNIAQSTASDPADAMISRRYAKMIKETPVVEITEHDKL